MSFSSNKAAEAEELNWQLMLLALQRRWYFVVAGIALGALTASWITSSIKKTWEGRFQIVISGNNQHTSLDGRLGGSPVMSVISSIGLSGGKGSELGTEVKVLESPYVLEPVFDEVRTRKTALGEDVSKLSFNSWSKNLSIKLEKGTEVLSVIYRDTSKDLILPTLNLLSDTYKEYSMRDRNESLKTAIRYAANQAEIYRQRSDASFRELNSFGLAYGISSSGSASRGTGGIDIAKLLNSSSNNGTSLNLSGNGTSPLKPNGNDPLAQLAQVNLEIISREQTFTSNDPIIVTLKKERDALRQYIESSAFGAIAYPGKQAISKERGQSIILRHQELERKANLDQSTLDSMESALLSLRLEQARKSPPWQLISPPVLIKQPVGPRPLRNLAVGLVAGMFFGCACAFIEDKRSGRVFSKDKLKDLLPAQLLLELHSSNPKTWDDDLKLLGVRNVRSSSIAILPVGEIQRNKMNRIREILKDACNTNIEICRTPLDATKFDKQLLIASPGSVKKTDLDHLVQTLSIQQTPTIGWIWLDNSIDA